MKIHKNHKFSHRINAVRSHDVFTLNNAYARDSRFDEKLFNFRQKGWNLCRIIAHERTISFINNL